MTDLNDAVYTGVYNFSDTMLHSPVSEGIVTGNGSMLVLRVSSFIHQIIFITNTNICVRRYNYSSWNNWVLLNLNLVNPVLKKSLSGNIASLGHGGYTTVTMPTFTGYSIMSTKVIFSGSNSVSMRAVILDGNRIMLLNDSISSTSLTNINYYIDIWYINNYNIISK